LTVLQLIKDALLLARNFFVQHEDVSVFGFRNPDLVIGQSETGDKTAELVQGRTIRAKDASIEGSLLSPILGFQYEILKEVEERLKSFVEIQSRSARPIPVSFLPGVIVPALLNLTVRKDKVVSTESSAQQAAVKAASATSNSEDLGIKRDRVTNYTRRKTLRKKHKFHSTNRKIRRKFSQP
jgi:hypothetical protein